MAQPRSLAQKYASISRPRSTGQTSYFSTLAKRTLAAEDDVVDHNYSIGLLSAEGYMNELTKRLSRPTNTPLQIQNFRQKIETVQESYNDSIMQNQYKAGQITDKDMYTYEKGKLDRMSAADSQAYQTQAAKVQGLLDKAEKTARKEYRISEMNRISRMPEDTSERMQAKADMYLKLRDMAVQDGDQSDAVTLDTSYNNYSNSAAQTKINEEFAAKTSAIKEEFHPSTQTEAGVQTDANQPAITTTPAGVSSGSVGFSGASGTGTAGVPSSSPAEPVDAGAQDAALQSEMQKQQERIAEADGDLQRALESEQFYKDNIAESEKYREAAVYAAQQYRRMGAADDVARLEEQIRQYDRQIIAAKEDLKKATVYITEIRKGAEEIKKDAAYKIGYVQYQSQENVILDAEQNLELSLQTGELTKEEYLQARRDISEQKVNLYNDLSTLYNEYDKTNPAADAARKAQKEELVNFRQATSDVNNAGRYELVDSGDGTVKLTDTYNLRNVSRTFEGDYLKDGNVYRKVLVPDAVDDAGNPMGLSGAIKNGYSAMTGTAFVVKMVDGVMTKVPVTVYNGQPILQSEIEQAATEGKLVYDSKKGTWADAPKGIFKQAGEIAQKVGAAATPFVKTPTGQSPLSVGIGNAVKGIDLKKTYETGSSAIKQLLERNKIDLTKAPITQTKGIMGVAGEAFNKVKGFAGTLLDKIVRAPVLEKVSGGEVSTAAAKKAITTATKAGGTVGDIIARISEELAPGDPEFAKVLNAIAFAESSFNPGAKGDQGRSIGLFQNNIVAGRGKGHTEEDLLDPEYNTRLAANDLIKYYNQGKKLGLSGAQLASYVSRYGQRPAAGLEQNAAKAYGQMAELTPEPSVTPMPTGDPNWPVSEVNRLNQTNGWGTTTTVPNMAPSRSAVTAVRSAVQNYNPQQTFQSNTQKVQNVGKAVAAAPLPKPVQNVVNSGAVGKVLQGSLNVQSAVKNTVANVAKAVSNAASSAKNWFGNLFRR